MTVPTAKISMYGGMPLLKNRRNYIKYYAQLGLPTNVVQKPSTTEQDWKQK